MLVRHHLPRRVTCTMLFEISLPLAALLLLLHSGRLLPWPDPFLRAGLLAAPFVVQAGFWLGGLYSRRCVYAGEGLPRRLGVVAAGVTLLLLPGLLAVRPLAGAAWPLLAVGCTAATVGCLGCAAATRLVVLRLFNHGAHYGRVLMVGDRHCVPHVVREVRRTHGDSLELVGVVGCPGLPEASEAGGLPNLGRVENLAAVAAAHRIDTVVMSRRTDEPGLRLESLVACRLAGVDFIDSADFYESICHKLLIERRATLDSLAFGSHRITRLHWRLKSGGEKILAAALAAVLALPAALVALAVRLDSSGPVIYRQVRVGRGGRPFTMFKFRTMRADAEAATGATWARRADPRVTPVGRWLRRTRFDELPQLLNILRGEMAFVGPRPERPEFVAELAEVLPAYPYRHLVKPGLTGWAQVNAGYGASLDDAREKLRFDLYYLKNMSLLLDAAIVAATVRAVADGNGVR